MNSSANDFVALDNSLSQLGLCEKLRCEIYQHHTAILHLGNVCFENNEEFYAEVSGETLKRCIERAADLLGIDCNRLKDSMLKRKFTKPANRMDDEGILYPKQSHKLNIYQTSGSN